MCKSLSYDDFRGIAISPIISKIFEYCYTFRKVVDSYVTRGTTANICTIDLSKAFDKVNHYALFIKIINRLFPVKLLNIIINLFSCCESCVKWDSVYSSMFVITSGVRQGSVLSPILFNLYINDLANINPGINRFV